MPVYSHSRLSAFEKCPLQYRYRYLDRIKRDTQSIEAFLGNRVHDALEKLYRYLLASKLPSLDEILSHYADFQIRTIDSFMTTIFKTSAIDFGYPPDFEILMDSGPLLEHAFNLFLRDVRMGSAEAELLNRTLRIIQEHQQEESPYLWDPSAPLLGEVKKIYRKLASSGGKPKIEDDPVQEREIQEGIRDSLESLEGLIARSGFERSNGSSYAGILSAVREGKFADLI